MRKIVLLCLFVFTLIPLERAFAAAAWTERLNCDHGQLVVDGLRSYETGFERHQLVLRNEKLIAYVESLAGAKLERNERAEVVAPIYSAKFDGSFDVNVIDVKASPDASAGVIYALRGAFNGIDFRIEVTQFSHYPGMTYHQPEKIGEWTESACKLVDPKM